MDEKSQQDYGSEKGVDMIDETNMMRDGAEKNSILIVDDEKANIMALSHILNPDYTVYATRDGENAVNAARKYKPDIILLDVLMPGMDGFDVISELKKSEKTRNIPIIFITGLTGADDEAKGLALGAADYISKPFNPEIVKQRVKNQLTILNQMHELDEKLKQQAVMRQIIIEKELAEETNRTKSEFLSRMSHEMRTPLNAVIGMTTLAISENDRDKKEEYLVKAGDASRNLLRLIDDVLDFFDMGENQFNLDSSEFSFADIARKAIDQVSIDIIKKRQRLTADIDATIPNALIGDGKRLMQAMVCLLSNSVKFTPEKGILQLKAFPISIDDEAVTLQIEVIDNGIGIPKEKQEILFVPFEQANGGSNREHGGVGLGLSIAKHIAEMMGGEIRVESEPDQGSKFTFVARLRVKPSCVKENDPSSFYGKTILLVDDVDINREIVMALLEDTHVQIDCAEDGREAYEKFSSKPGKYDLIIMDINMPGMDGVEATRHIRALPAPEGSRVPIIAMTANVLSTEVESYLAAGMDGHIGKPVDFNILLNTIGEYL
ncbi:MAG: response regulator [Clostridiales bacterium]|nr:response regulator [Clostridiales bacterium]